MNNGMERLNACLLYFTNRTNLVSCDDEVIERKTRKYSAKEGSKILKDKKKQAVKDSVVNATRFDLISKEDIVNLEKPRKRYLF